MKLQENNAFESDNSGYRQLPGDSSGPNPRCLATLPSNIEELITQFKKQEIGIFSED